MSFIVDIDSIKDTAILSNDMYNEESIKGFNGEIDFANSKIKELKDELKLAIEKEDYNGVFNLKVKISKLLLGRDMMERSTKLIKHTIDIKQAEYDGRLGVISRALAKQNYRKYVKNYNEKVRLSESIRSTLSNYLLQDELFNNNYYAVYNLISDLSYFETIGDIESNYKLKEQNMELNRLIGSVSGAFNSEINSFVDNKTGMKNLREQLISIQNDFETKQDNVSSYSHDEKVFITKTIAEARYRTLPYIRTDFKALYSPLFFDKDEVFTTKELMGFAVENADSQIGSLKQSIDDIKKSVSDYYNEIPECDYFAARRAMVSLYMIDEVNRTAHILLDDLQNKNINIKGVDVSLDKTKSRVVDLVSYTESLKKHYFEELIDSHFLQCQNVVSNILIIKDINKYSNSVNKDMLNNIMNEIHNNNAGLKRISDSNNDSLDDLINSDSDMDLSPGYNRKIRQMYEVSSEERTRLKDEYLMYKDHGGSGSTFGEFCEQKSAFDIAMIENYVNKLLEKVYDEYNSSDYNHEYDFSVFAQNISKYADLLRGLVSETDIIDFENEHSISSNSVSI